MGPCVGSKPQYKPQLYTKTTLETTGMGKAPPSTITANFSFIQENPVPTVHYQIPGNAMLACGYPFGLEGNVVKVMAERHQAERRLQEQQKFNLLMRKHAEMQEAYRQHNIDLCMTVIEQLTQLTNSIDFSLVDYDKNQRNTIEQQIVSIQQEYGDLLQYAGQIQKQGWQFDEVVEGIRISSKDQVSIDVITGQKRDNICMLMQKQIDMPIQIFLSILMEMDYYSELISYIQMSKEDKYIDRNHKIAYCTFNFPFVSTREVFFEGVGYNRLKHNDTLLMYCRSIHNKPDVCAKLKYQPKMNKDNIQIQFNYLVVKYVPICLNKGKVVIAMNIDIKLDMPINILKFFCKKIGRELMQKVVQISQNFEGSKWDDKKKENPDTFLFFQKSIRDYLILKEFL